MQSLKPIMCLLKHNNHKWLAINGSWPNQEPKIKLSKLVFCILGCIFFFLHISSYMCLCDADEINTHVINDLSNGHMTPLSYVFL